MKTLKMIAAVAVSLASFSARAELADYVGTWENVDQDTRGITKVNIMDTQTGPMIKTWGACAPKDCDWGLAQMVEYRVREGGVDTVLTAEYQESFKRTLLVARRERSRLRIEAYTEFLDKSRRDNYMAVYAFQRARPVETTTATLEEDCISHSLAGLELVERRAGWFIIDGGHSIMHFGNNEAEAKTAFNILRHYKANQVCYVGRPVPSMTYILSNGRSPVGPMTGEDCIRHDLERIRVQKRGSNWRLMENGHSMMQFPNEQEAKTAEFIIKKYNFTHHCFVGRPDPSMEYFRR